MSYALVVNGAIERTMNSLPSVWENVSNPASLTHEELADLSWLGHPNKGFYPIVEDIRPSCDEQTEKVEFFYELDIASHTVFGKWRVIPLTQEELDANANALAEELNGKWSSIRGERNALLNATDWTQLADCTLSLEQVQAWRQYRQALRDVPNQSDPFAIVWPEPPEPIVF